MPRLTRQFLRENFLGLSLTLIAVVTLALAGVSYQSHRTFPHFALANGAALDGADIDLLERQNKAYQRIAQSVTPAVVNIQSTQVVKVQQSPFLNDPFFRQFFGDLFGQIPREQREHALGSGVIVSPDGYILTNNHVVARASDIQILMNDKRSFRGKVVGADPQTDIAVVKIQARDLPTAPLGDSSTLRVGDSVMAIGNPFGLNFTVTRGIVSAVGRSGLGIEAYEDFIQTDAAINPGNSGGALVNVRGQVVGVNTAIVSGGRGMGGEGAFAGVGFAIPANMAKRVMETLITKGKISRGYLGLLPADLTPDLAREFHAQVGAGVLVQQVEPDTPAERAGLKAGDIVQTFNGRKVESANQFRFMVADAAAGSEVTLGILRDGRAETIRAKIEERPQNLAQGEPGGRERGPTQGTLRGIAVQNLTPSLRERLNLRASVRGVVITDIDPSSPAAQAGLEPGDIIASINRQPVSSVSDFNRLASQASGEILLYVVGRQGNAGFVVVSPEGEGQ